MDVVAVVNPEIRPEEWKLPSLRKVGMLTLIAAETALFTIFVVAYIYYIGKSVTGPFPTDVLKLPILASICLLSSSGTIVAAEKAFHKGDKRGFELYWGITFLLGAVFIGFTAHEWYEFIVHEGLTISTNLFGTTFYSLVGLHASHVLVGLILLGLVFVFSVTGKLHKRYTERLEMVSWYWHFVDGIWVIVFTVVYVIGMK